MNEQRRTEIEELERLMALKNHTSFFPEMLAIHRQLNERIALLIKGSQPSPVKEES